MQIRVACFAVVCATLFVGLCAQQYPGCKTTAECQLLGDKGAYCRSSTGTCHCSSPEFNTSFYGGVCEQNLCVSDKTCRLGGDDKAVCNTDTGKCACTKEGYGNTPSDAFCYPEECSSDSECRADGDVSAYCKQATSTHPQRACRCDVPEGYANYPNIAFCRIPPWVKN